MHFKHHRWSINELSRHWNEINPEPLYQRGITWDDQRQSLLIDSILGGFDIPKIYLRHDPTNRVYKYDIADGQQRLFSIRRFLENDLALVEMPDNHKKLEGKTFGQLTAAQKGRISAFEIAVTVVHADIKITRELFRRLQLGVPLNPAEMRNSMASALGDEIRGMAAVHPFFKNGPFRKKRFQTDDMAAHAFAVLIYKRTADMRASNLAQMYREFANASALEIAKKIEETVKRAREIFNFLNLMQEAVPGCVGAKWGFVDLVGVLDNRNLPQCDTRQMAEAYHTWEQDRKVYMKRPTELVAGEEKSRTWYLVYYIHSFLKDGAARNNLQTGFNILNSVLP